MNLGTSCTHSASGAGWVMIPSARQPRFRPASSRFKTSRSSPRSSNPPALPCARRTKARRMSAHLARTLWTSLSCCSRSCLAWPRFSARLGCISGTEKKRPPYTLGGAGGEFDEAGHSTGLRVPAATERHVTPDEGRINLTVTKGDGRQASGGAGRPKSLGGITSPEPQLLRMRPVVLRSRIRYAQRGAQINLRSRRRFLAFVSSARPGGGFFCGTRAERTYFGMAGMD
jgi:hypothetical protein